MSAPVCSSSDLIFVHGRGPHAIGDWQLDAVARLYGLTPRRLTVERTAPQDVLLALRGESTRAAIFSADALASIGIGDVLAALDRGDGPAGRLLVVGIDAATDPQLLREWSAQAVVGCAGPIALPSPGFYSVGDCKTVTRQLSSQHLPFPSEKFCHLQLDDNRPVQRILGVQSNGQILPVLVRAQAGRQEVFLHSRLEGLTAPTSSKCWPVTEVFPAIASLAMFVRYAAGDHLWHPPGHYANLTIDDPRLREPYGHLSYRRLLDQMRSHNFHTTIAFIPWNFDRNDSDVVALFSQNPDRFSLSIHGNNHDHLAFSRYDQRPLEEQAVDLGQAVARMERLRALTRLPYDRVMVFPHHISPAATLPALKRYNYIATMNSTNVPIDRVPPADPIFPLRAASLSFGNFPCVRRYPIDVAIPENEIAIDAFLENPLLFYGHHTSFAGGIDAFNNVADTVNRIQPDTQWSSLGHIARHLYLQRRTEPERYEALAYSSSVTLESPSSRRVTVFVRRDESDGLPIRSVTVEGQPYRYQRAADAITLEVDLPPAVSRTVVIEYQNDLDIRTIDISRSSLRMALVRYLSDFRDVMLARIPLGRHLIEMYYASRSRLSSRRG